MLDDNAIKMLNGECPQCKTIDNIRPYLPQVKINRLEQDLVCDNCGCQIIFYAELINFKFNPNVSPKHEIYFTDQEQSNHPLKLTAIDNIA